MITVWEIPCDGLRIHAGRTKPDSRIAPQCLNASYRNPVYFRALLDRDRSQFIYELHVNVGSLKLLATAPEALVDGVFPLGLAR